MGLTDLPGHDEKLTSNKTKICNSYRRYKGGNRNYCSHFSVIFETTSKFLIVFVKFILGKVGVDRFAGPRWKTDIKYEFGLKILLKNLGCK